MIKDFLRSEILGFAYSDLSNEDFCYIDKYWLNLEDLVSFWVPILLTTFSKHGGNISIPRGFQVDIRCGGILFDEDEFQEFTRDAKLAGGKEFAVIEDIAQNGWKLLNQIDFFRFSFPVDIKWPEISASCPLADDVFLRPIRCFYVIVDNGFIGKYVDNDRETPYEIAFKKNNN